MLAASVSTTQQNPKNNTNDCELASMLAALPETWDVMQTCHC